MINNHIIHKTSYCLYIGTEHILLQLATFLINVSPAPSGHSTSITIPQGYALG